MPDGVFFPNISLFPFLLGSSPLTFLPYDSPPLLLSLVELVRVPADGHFSVRDVVPGGYCVTP